MKEGKLFSPTFLKDSMAVLYSSNTNVTTIIRKMTAFNNGTSPVKIYIFMVDKGKAPTDETKIFEGLVAAKQSLNIDVSVFDTLEAGDSIRAYADTGETVSLRASGSKF